MAMKINEDGSLGEIIDPLNGTQDIEKRMITLAGAGGIVSDPLRILRAIRFAAKLGFDIEPSTLAEMKNKALLLKNTSPERILAELLLILETPQSAGFFRHMDQLGILEVVFPEIKHMKGCQQNSYHHKDVWEHSLVVMENGEQILNHLPEFFDAWSEQVTGNLDGDNRSALLKLATLLHDVGKPSTRDVNQETGRITFHDHDSAGAEIVGQISGRLKMSARDRNYLTLLVAEHIHVLNLSNREVTPRTKMKWFRKMKDDAIPAIILGISDVKGTLGVDAGKDAITGQIQWSRDVVREYYEEIKKKLERNVLITGRDLIALGIKPGTEMGAILAKILEAQDDGTVQSRDEALAMAGGLVSEKKIKH